MEELINLLKQKQDVEVTLLDENFKTEVKVINNKVHYKRIKYNGEVTAEGNESMAGVYELLESVKDESFTVKGNNKFTVTLI